jgi:hypothetical protein
MRAQIAIQAIFAASLLGSTISAVAQGGGASPVQGSVMHSAWSMQDYFQNLRNGTPAQPANPAPTNSTYYSDPNSGKPAVGGTTNGNGTKGEQ